MNPYRTVSFYTLGCKLNFSETSAISRLFEDGGYAKVDFEERPDIFVINTCSVTDNADKKCRYLVRKARKVNPNAFIIMLGCYAQLKPKEISEIEGVNMVLGANDKFNVIEHLEKIDETNSTTVVLNESIKKTKDFYPAFSSGERTRSFLKVQDGCDYFCSFCTIPLARGKSRNASISKTLLELDKLKNTGVKEIVLTGVNIGDFGQGKDENFFELVKALDEVSFIERFRISSIEPNLLSNEIIDFVLNKSKRFVPHFHIPLQSGSDYLLKKMRRKYDTSLYTDRVNFIKSIKPDCCIGVDVIVGYPGETYHEFQKTYEYLKDLDVSYLHVFTYSERANTTAIKLGEKIPMNVRKKRSQDLQSLSERKKRLFYQQHIQSNQTVLFENTIDNDYVTGFTENYIKVKIKDKPDIINSLKNVFLKEMHSDGVMLCE
ncbi:MAG: tRNA (N(6)-L-threonylcarbamoyladenosine(37)-C(2))-methylthiotransferase MtaB [Crocinitomicaceae bacterium]|nr:tRNA (N(6)-L-threonylcarbamoyladenosine(37)-C(2))-methylthiotransferase MtaB [Crocinitomicaceae bacterium]